MIPFRGVAHEHGYISAEPRVIEYQEGSMVILYLIYVTMNERYEVEYGGARLGKHGEIVIMTVNGEEGDAGYEKIMSSK